MEGVSKSYVKARRKLKIFNDSDILDDVEHLDDSDADPEYTPPDRTSECSSGESDDEVDLPTNRSGNANITPEMTSPSQHHNDQLLPIATSTPQLETSNPFALSEIQNKILSRKRKSNKAEWKRIKKSKAYNSGAMRKNNETSQRTVGPRCQCKRGKCFTITDEQRNSIFKVFWNEDSSKITRQSFIIAHTNQVPKRKQDLFANRSRGDSVKYFLTVDSHKVSVCQNFFLNTLGISSRMVLYNLNHTLNGVRVQPKKHNPHNKTPENVHISVADHIKSFPKVQSHYCRSDTKREYLEPHLKIREMFRLYKSASSSNTASEHFYRQVFNTEFNLGFHKPSKDQCDACDEFKKLTRPTPEQIANHDSHLRRKQQAYDSKAADKKREDGVLAVTFDLQQVLTVPRLFAGSCYYKRELNMYNLTFYELQSSSGHCYCWTEAEAHRGANDIASAIVMFLQKIDAAGGYREVVLYSDTCGGQNRNKVVITAILSFLETSQRIIKVSQKFFESGHSHMECDSMHSTIETAVRSQEIELPSDYMQVMKKARKAGTAYTVTELCHEDFKDYAALNSQSMLVNAFKGIINTHHIVYSKQERRDTLVMMADEIGVDLKPISYRKRGGKHNLGNISTAYRTPPGITKDKKHDLLSMLPHLSNQSIAKLYYNSLIVKEDLLG